MSDDTETIICVIIIMVLFLIFMFFVTKGSKQSWEELGKVLRERDEEINRLYNERKELHTKFEELQSEKDKDNIDFENYKRITDEQIIILMNLIYRRRNNE